MSDKSRVKYELEQSYSGKWKVNVYSFQEVESVEAGIEMIKSMYLLEDPDDIDPSIDIRGVKALDLIFGIGENK